MIFSPAPQPGAPHTSQRYHVVWVGLREQSAGRPARFPPDACQVLARCLPGAHGGLRALCLFAAVSLPSPGAQRYHPQSSTPGSSGSR